MLIPEGTFLTGAIRLRSRVDLHLVEGATLKFSTYPHQYPNVLTRWEDNDLFNYSPLVYAFRETDIAITGAGALDGQAGTFPNAQGVPMAWWSFTGPAGANGLTSQATGGCPHSARHCGDADRRARLRGYSAVTTPVAREAVRGGARQQADRRSDRNDFGVGSTFNVTTPMTSTFPFGDQIQAWEMLKLKNVTGNGTKLSEGPYSAPGNPKAGY